MNEFDIDPVLLCKMIAEDIQLDLEEMMLEDIED